MKLFIWLLFMVVFSSLVLAEVRVNEIMYNPSTFQGSDAELEWIELFNNGGEGVDLKDWQINGNDFDDITIAPNGFVVVARDAVNFQNYYNMIAVDGSFSLNNGGGTIELSNGTENWNCVYVNDYADGNGKTLEWTGTSWQEGLIDGGTPNDENSKAGFSQNFGALVINEFMPNPVGNDDADKPLGEWIEIYNPTETPMDLKGLVFYDKEDDHELYISDATTISGTVILAEDYLVVYRNGDTDFALNNDGLEEVRWYDGYPAETSNLIDSVSYSGATEGMSWNLVDGGWYKSSPSVNRENGLVNGCDWKVEVLPKESILNLGGEVEFDVVVDRNYGEASVLTVNGTIEDLNGEVIKSYRPWTNEEITTTRRKVYSPNLGTGVYKINFEIVDVNCQDNDLSNNKNSRIVAVNPRYKVFDSSLSIEEIYLGNDDEAEWGDRVRVKVQIYKGDETKYNVELYAEKDGKIVSKRTKTSAFDKYTNYTLTLPVLLEPNCNGYYLDGKYEMVLKGLEKEDRMNFRIEGNDKDLCKGLEEGGSVKYGSFGYKILEKPDKVNAGDDLKVKVEINGDKEEHNLKVWGYIYKGPKHYSDEKISEIKLKAGEVQVVDLVIKVDEDVKAGDYKLKIKINKDNQKTDKEMTEEIEIVEGEKQCVVVDESLSYRNVSVNDKLELLRRMNEEGKMVYLSSSRSTAKWLPIMIIGVLVFLSLILIFKKL